MRGTESRRPGLGYGYQPRRTTRLTQDPMSEKQHPMRWTSMAALVGLLLLAGIALAGCAAPAAIAAVEPTPTVYAPPPTDLPPPPPEPTPAALNFPLPAPTTAEQEPVSDQTCKDCHTDVDELKQTAEVIEVKESASEGEG